MQFNATPMLDRAPCRPSRAVFLERARAAVAAGEWSALPVLPTVLVAAERCGGCAGTGYQRPQRGGRRLRPCRECSPGRAPHPGFDLPRRSGRSGWVFTSGPDGLVREFWRPCQHCRIAPAKVSPWSFTGVRLPWQPDCDWCGDLGWTAQALPHGVHPDDIF